MPSCRRDTFTSALVLLLLPLLLVLLGPAPAVAAETDHPDLQGLQEGLELLAERQAKKAMRAFERADRKDSVPLAGMLAHLAAAYDVYQHRRGPAYEAHVELARAVEEAKEELPTEAEYRALLDWTRSRLEGAGKRPDPIVRVLHCHLKLLSEQETGSRAPRPEEQGIDDQAVHVGKGISAPKRLFIPAGPHTPEARTARIQGVVIVQAILDTDGCVASAKVLKGLPLGLNRNALTAARWWVSEPATLDGRPVAVYYNYTSSYTLQ